MQVLAQRWGKGHPCTLPTPFSRHKAPIFVTYQKPPIWGFRHRGIMLSLKKERL